MEIIYKNVNDLIPYENNPRRNEEAVKYVVSSIKEFGFKNPIIINNKNVIVCGHTRLLAAKKLNIKEVPCIMADDLSEEQIKAFRLVDNKTSEFAEWDLDLLSKELNDLKDFKMDDFGFDLDIEENKEIIEDNFEIELPEEPKSKIGDIYQLGNHRLMCGDSTNEEDIKRLVNNEVDLLLTDPPYNVNYEGEAGTIINDNQSSNDFYNFLYKAFKNAKSVMKNGASYYCWFASRETCNFYKAFIDNEMEPREELIWVKNSMTLGMQDYQWKHEPCLYGWKKGTHSWYSDRCQTTILEYDKPLRNDLHPTMKPILLFSYLIKNSSKKDDLVLDLFGGSGTTLMACEQLDRKCYIMEYDPKYVDVIIKRWEDVTGKKAIKI